MKILPLRQKSKKMKPIKERAIESFRSGLNCAQAVVTAYSDELHLDNNLAQSVSCAFGGGMGRLQETCGAVTGSFMVLGIHTCNKITENKVRKEVSYAMVQKFAEKFRELNGSTDCIDLLKCDLKTEEGNRYAKENNLFETVCEKCIADSINIVNELLEEKALLA
jgi:C_GCAxxG_C_C family probable redox protein